MRNDWSVIKARRAAYVMCMLYRIIMHAAYETCSPRVVELRRWQTRTHCCGHTVAHDVVLGEQRGKHC